MPGTVKAAAEEPAAEGPKYGGTLNVAVPNIVHLDVVGVNQYGLNEVAQLFYETLVDRDVNGEIQPLQTSFEFDVMPGALRLL